MMPRSLTPRPIDPDCGFFTDVYNVADPKPEIKNSNHLLGGTKVAKKILLLFFLLALFVAVQPAMAQEAQAAQASGAQINKWIAIACAFGLGFASAVCGLAQSNAIRGAVDGIARNPGAADSIRGALIIGLALIESLVIYVLLIAFMLYFKWA